MNKKLERIDRIIHKLILRCHKTTTKKAHKVAYKKLCKFIDRAVKKYPKYKTYSGK